jgi:hypothetical protein
VAEIRVVSIRGRIREVGPRLEHAPQIIYIGRRMTMGGWRLSPSPYQNPYTVKKCGSPERAVELFSAYLVLYPELVEQAAAEVAERGPGACFGCWCDVDAGAPCHGRPLAAAVTALTEPVPPLTTAWAAVHAPRTIAFRGRETVRLADAWAGAL